MVIKKKKKKDEWDISLLGMFVPGMSTPEQAISPVTGRSFSHDTEINKLITPAMSSAQALFWYASLGLLDITNLADVPVWRKKGFTYKAAIGLMLGRALSVAGIIGFIFDPLYKYTGPEEGQPRAPGLLYFDEIVEPIGSPSPLSWVFNKWTRRGIYG